MRDDDIYEPRLRDLIFWLLFFAAGIVKAASCREASAAFEEIDRQGVGFIAQHFIEGPQERGQAVDYRAFVIGDDVRGLRCLSKDWKRNYEVGTLDEAYELTPQQRADARGAVHAAKMGMGSVDILIDPKTGQHYISEVGDNIGLDEYDGELGPSCLSRSVVRMIEQKYGSRPGSMSCRDTFNATRHDRPGEKPRQETPMTPVLHEFFKQESFKPS